MQRDSASVGSLLGSSTSSGHKLVDSECKSSDIRADFKSDNYCDSFIPICQAVESLSHGSDMYDRNILRMIISYCSVIEITFPINCYNKKCEKKCELTVSFDRTYLNRIMKDDIVLTNKNTLGFNEFDYRKVVDTEDKNPIHIDVKDGCKCCSTSQLQSSTFPRSTYFDLKGISRSNVWNVENYRYDKTSFMKCTSTDGHFKLYLDMAYGNLGKCCRCCELDKKKCRGCHKMPNYCRCPVCWICNKVTHECLCHARRW
jgi:hypothetical protein